MSSPYVELRHRLGGLVLVTLALSAAVPAAAQGRRSDYERSAKLRTLTRNRIFRDEVTPHWSADGSRLWYRVQTAPDRCEFVVVDTARGVRRPAFDEPRLAKALRGKLLLIVGELDRNVDPASTMQVVSALIRADKDFDMLVIPGAGHGAAGTPYGRRRQGDYFVRHLLGAEPRRP